jgi:hypothetical protein
MKLGCVCAGESWPEGAWALDEVGMAGGFEDMAVPPAPLVRDDDDGYGCRAADSR